MPKVFVYQREHINTDEIIPARYLTSDVEAELAQHAMEDLDGSFVERAASDDILICGEDFGCGSSREHAVWAIRGAGVQAVFAPSFARIFYRNAINNGYPVFENREVLEAFEDGDEAALDIEAGTLTNVRTGRVVHFAPLPDFALDIARAGGLLEYLKAKEVQHA
ncbi:3-isopropylmalate dehydratase small subunit [Deinococcus yavapaiensis]|uniref:3-isopropylmalate dehydratase small subunit n=1 Tax=Deinococcus yavapaiensis KR-236 TaxID=694435 RepID=A0A318SBI5_9DEIO|nr:3-isopropylmalate dehydratase small subunit [Deinococcus yavapaiensis]PYE56408.1 3-isopropylmalate dehydratase small subunit [Deinococcus yavapaiensis KR-236]